MLAGNKRSGDQQHRASDGVKGLGYILPPKMITLSLMSPGKPKSGFMERHGTTSTRVDLSQEADIFSNLSIRFRGYVAKLSPAGRNA